MITCFDEMLAFMSARHFLSDLKSHPCQGGYTSPIPWLEICGDVRCSLDNWQSRV